MGESVSMIRIYFVIVIALAVVLAMCAHNDTLHVTKLDFSNRVNLTNINLTGELEKYPAIKEEMKKEAGSTKITRETFLHLNNTLNGSKIVKINNTYYKIQLTKTVSGNYWLTLNKHYPPDCPVFTEEELNKYPYLKKGVEKASRRGEAYIETDKLNYKLPASCIKYNGNYYGIGVSTP
ncbi:MAG: hypothetical protein ACLFVX_03270 [Archaeoglobaceae archaeon]